MKINQNISGFKCILIGFVVILMTINVAAQNGEVTSLKKSINIGDAPNIELNLYDLKAAVMPSSSKELRIELDYIADGKEEELVRLKDLLESSILKGTNGGKNASIELTFQSNFDLEIMGMKWNKITIKSDKNESIKLKEFKITRCEIWLPSTASIALNAKYSQVSFDSSINGNFNLDLYDGQLHLKDVSGYLKGEAKYSQIKGGSFKAVDLDIYECKLSTENSDAFNLDAKYSTIKIGETDAVRLGIYEGGFTCARTKTAQIENKYASINFDEVGEVKIDAYEGGLHAEKVNKLSLSAKYHEITLGNVQDFSMDGGYENEISCEKVNKLISKNGKYNEFTIGSLEHSFIQSGYEDEIEIENISPDFKKIELSGKYVEAGLTITNPTAYSLSGNVQYPGIDINEDSYVIRKKIGDSNQLEFNYEFGRVNEASSVIKINGYEMEVSIQH